MKENTGLNVTQRQIGLMKSECGIEKQRDFEAEGRRAEKQPNTPPEKKDAIRAAFAHFGMLPGGDA